MATIQLAFSLRTSTNVKTVHLVGNWDGYKGQLPLAKDPSKSGSWKGNFRFQQSMLQPGKRYWYYYMMDGYHVSHDPAKPFTKEPTTGRSLNILDVPKVSGSTTSSANIKTIAPRTGLGIEIPTGRGLSPSRIIAPKPSKPYASRGIREADYSRSPVDELSGSFAHARIYDDDDDYPSSPASAGSSLSSRSGGSSPSSLSSLSDRSGSSCRCNRFGITRGGAKVRLDCGGSKCGYPDDSSNCSSEESSEDERSARRAPVIKPKARITEIRPKQATTTSRRRWSAGASPAHHPLFASLDILLPFPLMGFHLTRFSWW